jgi:transposase
MVTNDSYITADSVCELLRKIAKLNLDVPITLVMDNARYQKCKIVAALADQLDIDLLFLPAYSPNLNLIERLWKFVKKKVLYSKYYPNFGEFRNAITDCLNQTHTTYKTELDSLLTLRFQVFKKCEVVPI